MNSTKFSAITLVFAGCIAAALPMAGVQATTALAPSAKLVVQGKIIATKCMGCHSAGLTGKKGFSPSLHKSGVLKEYTQTTFARVMSAGITNDGGHVTKPMPVYGMKAADSGALYAYLSTLK